MLDKGFIIEFPQSALARINKIDDISVPASGSTRDQRSLLWCSIDNDDSEDLDQLTLAMDLPSGEVKILVAIADVDSIVDKKSDLEDHARTNTTSVYTSAQIFPMLPEKLSTDLTSLRFAKDRLALVVEFVVAGDGSVKNSDIYRSVVQNKAKLAYHSTSAWLEGTGTMPKEIGSVQGLEQNLRKQFEASKKLKNLRYQHGALYLETPESKAVFEGDSVKDLREEHEDLAKDIIQEFMIAANGLAVEFLSSKKFPSIRRIVRVPKRWSRIVELAAEWKSSLPAQPDPKALEQFLLEAKKTSPDRFPELSLSVVKLLGPGEYVAGMPGTEQIGHFGLAVKSYTHSTAPNRRYPDLIIQRLLKAALGNSPVPYTEEELTGIASHCTMMENAAKKVERQIDKSTAALMLQSRIGEEFDAIVTGSSDKGTWVRIFNPPVDGKLVSGFEGVDVGQKIRVKLLNANVELGFIDFKKL